MTGPSGPIRTVSVSPLIRGRLAVPAQPAAERAQTPGARAPATPGQAIREVRVVAPTRRRRAVPGSATQARAPAPVRKVPSEARAPARAVPRERDPVPRGRVPGPTRGVPRGVPEQEVPELPEVPEQEVPELPEVPERWQTDPETTRQTARQAVVPASRRLLEPRVPPPVDGTRWNTGLPSASGSSPAPVADEGDSQYHGG
jgi:hypothetical protein